MTKNPGFPFIEGLCYRTKSSHNDIAPQHTQRHSNHINAMNGTQKVKLISLGLVIVSAISIAMLTLLIPDQLPRLPLRLVRLVITCVFAYLLVRGTSWVRWFVGLISIIGGIFSFVGIGTVGLLSLFGLWMIVMGVFYFAVAYFLFLDAEVAAHFQ